MNSKRINLSARRDLFLPARGSLLVFSLISSLAFSASAAPSLKKAAPLAPPAKTEKPETETVQIDIGDTASEEVARELAKVTSRKWLERFDVKVGENPLKVGWEGGNLEDGKLDFQYIWQKGNTFLRSRSLPGVEANALKKKDIDWDSKEFPLLRWRWRVQKFPTGAKILDGDKSDAGAQVYILWKGVPTYYVMKYFWATEDKIGTLLEQSTLFLGKLRGLVIRSGGKTDEWHTETRNVHADFIKYFGGEPPGKVRGIAVLSDADETKTQSEADYDDFEILR